MSQIVAFRSAKGRPFRGAKGDKTESETLRQHGLKVGWIDPLVDKAQPLFVNLLSIDDDVIRSDNAEADFAAAEFYDLDANVVADDDFFADFS